MGIASSESKVVYVYARDHVDSEGSVVRSGMALAEAVLKAIENSAHVEIDLEGIKGASSSYFNVFLRRMEEGCGLAVFEDRSKLRFASNVQELVYSRSIESMKRGVSNSKTRPDQHAAPYSRSWFARLWTHILTIFRKSL